MRIEGKIIEALREGESKGTTLQLTSDQGKVIAFGVERESLPEGTSYDATIPEIRMEDAVAAKRLQVWLGKIAEYFTKEGNTVSASSAKEISDKISTDTGVFRPRAGILNK